MFRKAHIQDVPSLQKLLIDAWHTTYENIYAQDYIEQVIQTFYNEERLKEETRTSSKAWLGYYVVEEDLEIVGGIGGGIDEKGIGQIYVLYLDPHKKRKGYGSLLVDNFTLLQKQEYNITKQQVSVTQNNTMAIPFYKKKGFVEKSLRESGISKDVKTHYDIVMERVVE